jgi:hypothetical protein
MRISPFLMTVFLVACGSGDGGGTGGAGGTGAGGGGGQSTSSTSTTATSTHTNACVLTTDTGNANGVGHYCTPGGGECSGFSLAGLCLADVGQDEWFCTRIGCSMDSECGDDAVCHIESAGSACIPSKCQ